MLFFESVKYNLFRIPKSLSVCLKSTLSETKVKKEITKTIKKFWKWTNMLKDTLKMSVFM